MGPDRATEAIRKALSMGADAAVHLSRRGARGLGRGRHGAGAGRGDRDGRDVDLVLAGNEASDGRSAAVPAMVAEVLGLPALTHARKVTVEGGTVTVRPGDRRRGRGARARSCPRWCSVDEKINEPRYPSFKGIMAAKKKTVTTLSLADAGLDASRSGRRAR